MDKKQAEFTIKQWLRAKAAVEGGQVTDYASSGVVDPGAVISITHRASGEWQHPRHLLYGLIPVC